MVDNRTAHFTYIWAIENASKLHFSKSFRSPMFITDSEDMHKTKWQLTIDPGIEYLTFFIRRLEKDDGPNTIEIDYEISLLSVDGYPLVKMMDRKQFKNSSNYALRRLANSDEVFNVRKDDFLPKDTLTVQCRIWRKGFGISKGDLHYVRTQKSMDRIYFVWTIKNFSNLQENEKRTHIVNPTTERVPQLTASFYLLEKQGTEKAFVHIDISAELKCQSIHGRVCLLDANGGVYHSIQIEDYVYLNHDSKCLSKAVYPKSQIMANKESLLPNDVLTFRCEFEIDTEPFCCHIEQYTDFDSSDSERIIAGIPEIQFVDTPETSGTASALKKFLIDNFKEGTLSDVCLRAGSESFPVHKLILSAFSPVFKAMFTKDTQEKTSGFVYISDVHPDTLRLLLSYIYTNTIADLQWKSAEDLFKASDKYGMIDLRDKCSDFLKSNLTVGNCCNILAMADRHHNQNLRTSVYGFMIKHQSEIFKSDMWKTFKSENFALAMNTLELIISFMKNTEDL
ncbi:Speckle-type POZ protein [Araneus ventricosus]|uniref:Speckle-type POZ protein n=1 Tax=Araneus ventricosus TaxID=182803 RepID=A0A4Y2T514_ARAVE|nr:Speckle-type POZ protein [Araneus ventricosus]GBN95698.1 Speckle-type POZ protein [Araneus ventricosus]